MQTVKCFTEAVSLTTNLHLTRHAGWLQRQDFLFQLEFFEENEDAILIIQDAWRRYKQRKLAREQEEAERNKNNENGNTSGNEKAAETTVAEPTEVAEDVESDGTQRRATTNMDGAGGEGANVTNHEEAARAEAARAEAARQEAAATRIQASYRGFQGRKSAATLREAKAAEAAAAAEAARAEAARAEAARQEAAATRIQASYRGFQGRKSAATLREAKAAEAAAAAEAAREEAARAEAARQEAAATRIQASYRGFQGRKSAATLREAKAAEAAAAAEAAREEAARAEAARQEAAATRIQASYRGFQGRKSAATLREAKAAEAAAAAEAARAEAARAEAARQEAAATRIQASYRGFQGRKSAATLREAKAAEAAAAAEAAREEAARAEAARQEAAATRIQASYRGFQGRKSAATLREAKAAEAAAAAEAAREEAARAEAARQEAAATRIQASYRGLQGRKSAATLREAKAAEARAAAVHAPLQSQLADNPTLSSSTTLYTAHDITGFTVAEDFNHDMRHIIQLQAVWRGCLQRMRYRRLFDSPVTIQAIRAYMHILNGNAAECQLELELNATKRFVMIKADEITALEKQLALLDLEIGRKVRTEEAILHDVQVKGLLQPTLPANKVDLPSDSDGSDNLLHYRQLLFVLLHQPAIWNGLARAPDISAGDLLRLCRLVFNQGSGNHEQALLLGVCEHILETEIFDFPARLEDGLAQLGANANVAFAWQAAGSANASLGDSDDFEEILVQELVVWLDNMQSRAAARLKHESPAEEQAKNVPGEERDVISLLDGDEIRQAEATVQQLGLPSLVSNWSVPDVGRWLERDRFKAYSKRFESKEIDGRKLLALDSAALLDLGLLSTSARRLAEQIALLRAINEKAELAHAGPTSTGALVKTDGVSLEAPRYGCSGDPHDWTLTQVLTWLKRAGHDDAVSAFVQAEVSGANLSSLDAAALKMLGVHDPNRLEMDINALFSSTVEAGLSASSADDLPEELHLAFGLLRTLWSRRRNLRFGVCYLTGVLNKSLQRRYPQVARLEILRAAGLGFYYQYLRHAMQAALRRTLDKAELPSAEYDLVTQTAARSFELVRLAFLGERSFRTASVGLQADRRLYDRFFLQATSQLLDLTKHMTLTASLEEYFGLDEFSSFESAGSSTVYMSLVDLFRLHELLISNYDSFPARCRELLRPLLGAFEPRARKALPGMHLVPDFVSEATVDIELSKHFLARWQVEDVSSWLEDLQLNQYILPFATHLVNGKTLLKVKKAADFSKYGVVDYKDSMVLFRNLRHLRLRLAAAAAVEQPDRATASRSGLASVFSPWRRSQTPPSAPEGIKGWSAQECVVWLTKIGFERYESLFQDQKVTGKVLDAMEDGSGFERLGVRNVKDCMAMFRHLNAAKVHAGEAALPAAALNSSSRRESASSIASSVAGSDSPLTARRRQRRGPKDFYVPCADDFGRDARDLSRPLALDVVRSSAADVLDTRATSERLDHEALLAKTKKMVVDLLRQSEATSIPELLTERVTPVQEAGHRQFTARQQSQPGLNDKARTRALSIVGTSLKKLQSMATNNLETLSSAGLVQASNNYQDVLDGIAKDIRFHAHELRARPRELRKLREAKARMEVRLAELQERIESYRAIAKTLSATGGPPTSAGSSAGRPGAVGPSTHSLPNTAGVKTAKARKIGTQFGTHTFSGAKLKQKKVFHCLTASASVTLKEASSPGRFKLPLHFGAIKKSWLLYYSAFVIEEGRSPGGYPQLGNPTLRAFTHKKHGRNFGATRPQLDVRRIARKSTEFGFSTDDNIPPSSTTPTSTSRPAQLKLQQKAASRSPVSVTQSRLQNPTIQSPQISRASHKHASPDALAKSSERPASGSVLMRKLKVVEEVQEQQHKLTLENHAKAISTLHRTTAASPTRSPNVVDSLLRHGSSAQARNAASQAKLATPPAISFTDSEGDAHRPWLPQSKRAKWSSSNLPRKASSSGGASEGSVASVSFEGFRNVGNTCYLNAVLQSLLAVHCFVDDLREFATPERFAHSPTAPAQPSTVTCALQKLIKQIDQREKKQLAPIDPSAIKHCLAQTATAFEGWGQQDAHEFLSFLLDRLLAETEDEDTSEPGSPASAASTTSLAEAKLAPRSPSPINGLGIIPSNFGGELLHQRACTGCKRSSSWSEAFLVLSLELPSSNDPSATPPTLQKLLATSLAPEDVEYKCESCDCTTSRLTHRLSRLPRCLILHVKRFTYDLQWHSRRKLHQPIRLERSLQTSHVLARRIKGPVPVASAKSAALPDHPLKRVLFQSTDEASDEGQWLEEASTSETGIDCAVTPSSGSELHAASKYRIVAVTRHHGTTEGGHYIADVLDREHGWRVFDDSRVTKSDWGSVRRANERDGYLYFYVHDSCSAPHPAQANAHP
ncbi:uncharacterized protein MONBRDRAFT_24942 [Monosiga brevicollis MX1]|uniref:Calmodulin n=1 Tax=Monosiga brevicollis TaxID=81824 RepID=A9UY73_MONBE|nr:uncharacterized protein MONBRDRAFT_24942 [Monosiga brevicollis MX1]EDQ89809.1 predicted protein [Monosiga brevicollis MX1]|eukprot:XP_001745231.1 hypothetical protein [Monosiga brevicollis MX1]